MALDSSSVSQSGRAMEPTMDTPWMPKNQKKQVRKQTSSTPGSESDALTSGLMIAVIAPFQLNPR